LLISNQAPAQTLNSLSLIKGWNLIGNNSSSAVNVANILNNSSTVTSVWKWDANAGKWAFYSPSLSSAALSSYASDQSYEVLSSINSGEGFWVNASTAFGLSLSSSSNSSSSTSPSGVWQGASSSGYTVDLLVLPNGHFYTVFGNTTTSGGLTVSGFDVGTATVSSGNVTATLNEYIANGQSVTGNLTAAFSANTSLIGLVTYSNNYYSTFSLTPLLSLNFNTAASLSNVSGSWSGTFLTGATGTASISSAGVLTGTSSGCSYTGTVTPDSSGMNFFDVTVTFGASPCLLPNQTVSGAAIAYSTTTGKTQLIVTVTNSANTLGTLFTAQR
jgi:hypothetical protein